ncbi:hypothetical protein KM043_007648 [Ampulex compressa]|nr:hypothetical protein KM043_007648 [Ampulex compressa]
MPLWRVVRKREINQRKHAGRAFRLDGHGSSLSDLQSDLQEEEQPQQASAVRLRSEPAVQVSLLLVPLQAPQQCLQARPHESQKAREAKSFLEDSLKPGSVSHPCPSCHKTFKRKSSISRHLLYSCGQKPRFKCPYCGNMFSMRSNIYHHIRKMHKKLEVYAVDVVKCTVKKP